MLKGVTSPSPTLDPDAARGLIALRLMLQDAVNRAQTSHRFSRGAAIVALDATVERVSYLVALRRGLDLSPKATLADIYSKLVASFATTWKPTAWPQVRNLHESRNGAQHKGLVPDRDDLPGWVEAAKAYVTSLVEVEYGVDLWRVTLGDAVRDQQLADLLRESSSALAAGDVPRSVEASLKAFDSAVGRWSGMHNRDRRQPRSSFHPQLGFVGEDVAGKAISDMRRRAAEASFASSGAEHEWFDTTRREDRGLLDADDAERVLAFTFSWVVSFEVAAQEWVPNRRRRADIAARRVRQQAAQRASIAAIAPVNFRPPLVQVKFELADVPKQGSYDEWAAALGALLIGREHHRWWVEADGTVTLSVSGGEQPTAADVTTLADALGAVEETLTAGRATREREAAEQLARTAEHERAVAAVGDQLPDWVTSLTWDPSRRYEQTPVWRVTVSSEVSALRFEESTGGAHPPDSVWALLRNHELVNGCYTAGAGAVLSPDLDPAQLVDVFADVDQQVRDQLSKVEKIGAQRQATLADIQADLAAALSRVRNGT